MSLDPKSQSFFSSFLQPLSSHLNGKSKLKERHSTPSYAFEVCGSSTPPPPVTYSLTTNTTGQGSISLSPSGGTYDEGIVVSTTNTY